MPEAVASGGRGDAMRAMDAFLDLLTVLASDFRLGGLLVLLAMAAAADWRFCRVPNWLTFGGMAFALAYGSFASRTPLAGALHALGGLGIGFAIMLPFYLMGVLGAGDVKLMAMVGAYLGPAHTPQAALFTCLAGGLAAVALSLHRRCLGGLLVNAGAMVRGFVFPAVAGGGTPRSTHASVGRLPYGLCICAGAVTQVLAHQMGCI